jgi:hypothetical protein
MGGLYYSVTRCNVVFLTPKALDLHFPVTQTSELTFGLYCSSLLQIQEATRGGGITYQSEGHRLCSPCQVPQHLKRVKLAASKAHTWRADDRTTGEPAQNKPFSVCTYPTLVL